MNPSLFRRYNGTRLAVSGLALSVFLAGAGTSAQAAQHGPDEAAKSVNAIANTASRAAPDGSSASMIDDFADIGPDARTSGALSAGDMTLPRSGKGTLTSHSTGIEISLPPTLETGDAKISEGGLAVYESTDARKPSAVIAITDMSSSVQLVVPSDQAAKRYSFKIDGAKPVINEDGSATLIDQAIRSTPSGEGADSQPAVLGLIAPPWAKDANGAAVPTHFEVEGNALVQVIEFKASTAFPVVADPDFIFIGKCAAAVVIFVAENGIAVGKFWRVFKSTKALINVFRGLKGMKFTTKAKYVSRKLGYEAGKLSGIGDLVGRCTP